MGKNLRERMEAERRAMFDAGFETGQQYAADAFAYAMKEAGISRPQIIRITMAANDYERDNLTMFDGRKKNPDCDVERDRRDRYMQDVFGNYFSPFSVCYPYIEEPR